MISKLQYVEFLISIIGNYTGTHLAEHLDQTSQDAITDFLQSERLAAHHLWKLVHGLLADSPDAFLLADDSVQDKRYSRFLELVHRQYSGAEFDTKPPRVLSCSLTRPCWSDWSP
jgi:hypothetical protein